MDHVGARRWSAAVLTQCRSHPSLTGGSSHMGCCSAQRWHREGSVASARVRVGPLSEAWTGGPGNPGVRKDLRSLCGSGACGRGCPSRDISPLRCRAALACSVFAGLFLLGQRTLAVEGRGKQGLVRDPGLPGGPAVEPGGLGASLRLSVLERWLNGHPLPPF